MSRMAMAASGTCRVKLAPLAKCAAGPVLMGACKLPELKMSLKSVDWKLCGYLCLLVAVHVWGVVLFWGIGSGIGYIWKATL